LDERERILCTRALNKWGAYSQVLMLFEEMSELQKAVCKFLRGQRTVDKVVEEIADVEIMLTELKVLLGPATKGLVEQQIARVRKEKLDRLELLLAEKEEEH